MDLAERFARELDLANNSSDSKDQFQFEIEERFRIGQSRTDLMAAFLGPEAPLFFHDVFNIPYEPTTIDLAGQHWEKDGGNDERI